ncbi:MAG: SDR family oxidoreductase, partial [Verrucomicrobiota bacterium]
VEEITSAGGIADFLATDVVNQSEVTALVEKARENYGRVDVMINNAGVMSLAPFSERKVDEWNRMVDINIKGVLYGIAAALPIFEQQESGHFINISSVAGIKVFEGGGVYCGTKFAVRAISEGLRMEAGEHIRTTTIEPGAIRTELKHGTSHRETSEWIDDLYENVAIPADSIARAVAYAIEQPADVDINELVIRPTAQEL